MKKVGRNDPCPCGSGKKYKKCCEKKSAMQKRETKVLTGSAIGNLFQSSVASPSAASSLKDKKVTSGKVEKKT